MKADWQTLDDLTALQAARLDCVRLDCLGLYQGCNRDPRQCGTHRRLTAPRSALCPSDEQMQEAYEVWVMMMMAAFALLALVVALLWAGGA